MAGRAYLKWDREAQQGYSIPCLLSVISVGVFPITREEVDPVRNFKARAQITGIVFCLRSSPSCSFAWLEFKKCQLTAVQESLVGDISQCGRDVHFFKSSTEHEGFSVNLLQCGRKPNALKTYTM